MAESVVLHGYKQKDELPPFFRKADVFLFPTHFDIWGLVLVEAMAAGLVCFASVRAGATQDLIEDGVNGYACDFNRLDTIADRMCDLAEKRVDGNKIGERAAETIAQKATIAQSAAGIRQAILMNMGG